MKASFMDQLYNHERDMNRKKSSGDGFKVLPMQHKVFCRRQKYHTNSSILEINISERTPSSAYASKHEIASIIHHSDSSI
jgi:hypothetical protein